jgi:hypothetical protein
MTASELIQQEHVIVQYYFTNLKEYKERKKQVTETSEQQKKDTLSTQEEQKTDAQAKLEKVS